MRRRVEAREKRARRDRNGGYVYGDNVFKKNGINRDGTGKHKKTRLSAGKRVFLDGIEQKLSLHYQIS